MNGDNFLDFLIEEKIYFTNMGLPAFVFDGVLKATAGETPAAEVLNWLRINRPDIYKFWKGSCNFCKEKIMPQNEGKPCSICEAGICESCAYLPDGYEKAICENCWDLMRKKEREEENE